MVARHLGQKRIGSRFHDLDRLFEADLFPISYDPAHGAGWDPYNPQHMFPGSDLLYKADPSCTTSHNGR